MYDRLTPARRVELHGRAAIWYERRDQESEARWHREQASSAKEAAGTLLFD